MSTDNPNDNKQGRRELPAIDRLLRDERVGQLVPEVGIDALTRIAREQVALLRSKMGQDTGDDSPASAEQLYDESVKLILEAARYRSTRALRNLINATGVVLHTNLGRAPLSESAVAALSNAARYCDVEYDLEQGRRGPRGRSAEEKLAELTGAEDALIVNNCAAATLLVLTDIGRGGEAIISRGELVEIGGDFRVPDVLSQSGVALKEVGTTNRTKLADYEEAIGPDTRLILRVHPSNFRMIGFTASAANRELAELAHREDVIFFEDAGSGAMVDLGDIGLTGEPVIPVSIQEGVDLVAFSGDKLLGGPQCGIIVGRRELIGSLRAHPLYRALRVSKLIYAGLEATLKSHLRGAAFDELPVLKMLSMSYEELDQRCLALIERFPASESMRLAIVKGRSVAGGGSLPGEYIDSPLIAVEHSGRSAEELAAMLRKSDPPVIARIERDSVLIDLRTVFEEQEDGLLAALSRCGSQNPA